VNAEPLVSAVASILQPFLSQTGTLLATLASATASAVGVIALIVILAFYMLVDLDGAEERLAEWAPPDYRQDFLRLLQETTLVWRAFVRGQLLLGLVLGWWSPPSWPPRGTVSRCSPIAALLATSRSSDRPSPVDRRRAAFFRGQPVGTSSGFRRDRPWGILVIQQIENTILIPGILGFSLKMRPLTVLLAAMAGGSLAGVVGVLLAQPVAAMLRVWFFYFYRKTAGLDPWPEPPAPPAVRPPRPAWPWLRKRVRRPPAVTEQASNDGR
jgi:hypothetical protein